MTIRVASVKKVVENLENRYAGVYIAIINNDYNTIKSMDLITFLLQVFKFTPLALLGVSSLFLLYLQVREAKGK